MRTKTTVKTMTAMTLGVALFAATAQARPGGKGCLKKADADEDGEVTYEEFLAQAKARFAKMDGNDDGVVTKEELKEMAKARRAESGEKRKGKGRKGRRGGKRDASKLFTDKNDDGVVTIEDVPERAERLFKRVDQDGDGEISAEEKEAFVEKMKERRAQRGERRRERKGKRREN